MPYRPDRSGPVDVANPTNLTFACDHLRQIGPAHSIQAIAPHTVQYSGLFSNDWGCCRGAIAAVKKKTQLNDAQSWMPLKQSLKSAIVDWSV